MSSSLPSTQRWLKIRSQFALDALIILVATWAAAAIRFSDGSPAAFNRYLPAILVSCLVLPALIYIFGLYSVQGLHLRRRERLTLLLAAFLLTMFVQFAMGSMSFSSRMGRGVVALQMPIGLGLLMLHHGILVRRSLGIRRRVALVIVNEKDEQALKVAEKLKPAFTDTTGYFRKQPLEGMTEVPYLGGFEQINPIMNQLNIDALVCSSEHLRSDDLAEVLREVCFSGQPVLSIADLIEEAYEAVPLAMVDMEWLILASSMPRRRYARKLKRLFDVVVTCCLGLVLLPVFLAGILLVRITSEGPVFYRQERSGRYGRRINVWKLRTMKTDAEKNGAQWAAGRSDPRLTPVGGLLRTFRIDEIPQLWNILVGDMSLVGPRPERPEFVAQLATHIPFYRERLLIQPGLTGWAQVCYPYGASVEDSRRKLEYDLYYLKHMSLMLDLFILLDTVRTILRGGAKRRSTGILVEIEEMMRQDLSLADSTS